MANLNNTATGRATVEAATNTAQQTASVLTRISAADARNLADTTTKFIHRLYKEIREAASEGMTKITWSVYELSEVLLETTIDELENSGYSVEVVKWFDEEKQEEIVESLFIKW